MKKFHFIIIFAFILISLCTFSVYAKSPDIPDDIPYILVDSKTGQVIAEQHADELLRPASTTKIMTAIVAIENGDFDQMMEVSQQAVYDIGKGGMNIGIMAGEEGLTLKHMLNVMLIKSANEAANIIAENLAGSRREFVDLMNKRAKELGAVNTNFVNPSGKDTEKEDANHLSTPRDMAIIARHAMTLPEFREIVRKEYYEDMPVTNKHNDWGILRNTNQLLWYDNTYPYTLGGTEHEYTVIGIKTGYTAAAGNNLIAAATGEDGMELISVVMHVTQPNKIYGYTKELLRYGFEHYSMQTISKAGQVVSAVPVENAEADGAFLPVVTAADFSSALPIDTGKRNIEMKINVDSPVKAPVNKGDVLGYVEYRNNGVLLGKVNVIASKSIKQASGMSADAAALNDSSDSGYSYAVLTILLALSGFVLLRMALRKISRRIKKKKYAQKYPD